MPQLKAPYAATKTWRSKSTDKYGRYLSRQSENALEKNFQTQGISEGSELRTKRRDKVVTASTGRPTS